MKKALLTLYFFATVLSLTAQQTGTLKNTVYKFGSKGEVNSGELSGTECALQRLLFVTDSTFLSINRCKDIETLASGQYNLTKSNITLNYSNTVLIRYFDTEAGYTVYVDSLVRPRSMTLKSFTKKKQLQFKGGDMIMVPAAGYAGLMQDLEEDNRAMRLGIATKSNLNIFENTDFSQKYDSLIIKRGLEKLNAEMTLDFFDDENKLGDMPNGGVYEGKVHYSPDGKFKIFVFAGESCGAHCNSLYTSYVQFSSGAVSEIDVADIITLQKYCNNYIVIDTSWSGGTIGGNDISLQLFSAENDSVNYHALVDGIPEDPALGRFFKYQQNIFTIFSPWWASGSGKMEYDSALHKIRYSYIDSGIDPEYLAEFVPEYKRQLNLNEGLLVSGEFKIEEGVLTDFTEKYEIVILPDE